ncbi:UNVERIFIED_CONTAM: hypothetical protein HDU68_000414 [Siphonaria sp. JEL0065]|nr:hypothetical protein HDU68_000414 [Siphonaria sp. JEL0065]
MDKDGKEKKEKKDKKKKERKEAPSTEDPALLDNFQEQLTSLQSDFASAEAQIVALANSNVVLEESLKSSTESANETIRKLRAELQIQKDNNVKLNAELTRTKNIAANKVDDLEKEKRNLASAFNTCELEKQEMVNEYAAIKQERDALAADVEKRKKKLKKKDKEIEELEADKKSLKSKVFRKTIAATFNLISFMRPHKVAKYKVEKETVEKLNAELEAVKSAKTLVDQQLSRAIKEVEKAKASFENKEVKLKEIETKTKITIEDKLRAMKEKITASIDETVQLLLSGNGAGIDGDEEGGTAFSSNKTLVPIGHEA